MTLAMAGIWPVMKGSTSPTARHMEASMSLRIFVFIGSHPEESMV
jgi:hypothetical protein